MKKLNLLTFLSIFEAGMFSNSASAQAEDFPRMGEIIVKSPGAGRFLDAPGVEAMVITAEEIGRMQAGSLPELLNSISSIHLTERGAAGSQADISIRGSSIEGVLLLINGVRAQDPQTGHFLLDIPLGLESVERIEILAGGGSTLYGSTASGGIVNIVTREKGFSKVGLAIGSFGGKKGSAGISGKSGKVKMTAGAQWERSDGHSPGTDLQTEGIDGSGSWRSGRWHIRWNAGMMQRHFGARGFYGSYPSFEEVTAVQAGVNGLCVLNDRSMVRMRAGSRGHRDIFTLIRDQPDYYRNTHFNRSSVVGGDYFRLIPNGRSFTLGAEVEYIGITSGNLGNHTEGNTALYGEYQGRFRGNGFAYSLRYDHGRRNEQVISPGFGIVFPLSGVYELRARFDRSFRAPTYTELYYSDPVNRGNPELESEHSASVEAGLRRNRGESSAEAGVFAVRSTRVIDWVRNQGEAVWSAVNHGRIITAGIDFSYASHIYNEWRLRGSASFLRQSVRERRGRESKYMLNPAEEIIAAALYGPLAARIECALSARYEKMHSGDARIPVDVRVARRFDMIKLLFSAQNIGNERYEEIPGLQAPGRRYRFELEFAG